MAFHAAPIQKNARVDILLSTYEGARFIEDQLDSIIEQMDPGCRLLIRDDGSKDGTPELVERYAAHSDGKIVLMKDGLERLRARGSFSRLLEASDADYVVLCDQDDIWLPGRISKPVERIRRLEQELGNDVPILVHTDLVVVDEELRTIAPSFCDYIHINPRRGASLNRLLVQNIVTGCASTFNRALVNLARPIPPQALMHDWWLGMIAAALGRLEYLAEPTVLYRQHGSNNVGAFRWSLATQYREARDLMRMPISQIIHDKNIQAKTFLERFHKWLRPGQRRALEAFMLIEQSNFMKRRGILIRHGFFLNGWLRNLSWVLMS